MKLCGKKIVTVRWLEISAAGSRFLCEVSDLRLRFWFHERRCGIGKCMIETL